jgi:hypothetical protein
MGNWHEPCTGQNLEKGNDSLSEGAYDVYYVLNDAFDCSDCTALNDMMIHK